MAIETKNIELWGRDLADKFHMHIRDGVGLANLSERDLFEYDRWLGTAEGARKIEEFKAGASRPLVKRDTTALAIPTAPITSSDVIDNAIESVRKHRFNLLGSVRPGMPIPEGYAITLATVDLPTSDSALWYKVDGGKLAPSKVALDRLAELAGISDEYTKRVDDGKTPFRWEYESSVLIRALDGSTRRVIRRREVDLSDTGPDFTLAVESAKRAGKYKEGSVPAQIQQARKFGAAICESKAHNRAVRAALGIAAAMEPAKAEKPFVVPKLTWVPPRDNAAIQQMIAAKELGLVDALFGGRPANQPTIAAEPTGEIVNEPDVPMPYGDDDGEETPWTE
jgi:hypothetical protein